jgi:hypothetical protein
VKANETPQDREVAHLRRQVRALHAALEVNIRALASSTSLSQNQKEHAVDAAQKVADANRPQGWTAP